MPEPDDAARHAAGRAYAIAHATKQTLDTKRDTHFDVYGPGDRVASGLVTYLRPDAVGLVWIEPAP